ncbi:MAG: hypothetical protein JXL84_09220 [Deltaproteobacteria bacterium]|nr:hypothetical protein [Deltaproteobacteria bacterium]
METMLRGLSRKPPTMILPPKLPLLKEALQAQGKSFRDACEYLLEFNIRMTEQDLSYAVCGRALLSWNAQVRLAEFVGKSFIDLGFDPDGWGVPDRETIEGNNHVQATAQG